MPEVKLDRSCQLCELAGKRGVRAGWDAKTYQGPWAYVCEDHLKSHCVPNFQLRTKLLPEDSDA